MKSGAGGGATFMITLIFSGDWGACPLRIFLVDFCAPRQLLVPSEAKNLIELLNICFIDKGAVAPPPSPTLRTDCVVANPHACRCNSIVHRICIHSWQSPSDSECATIESIWKLMRYVYLVHRYRCHEHFTVVNCLPIPCPSVCCGWSSSGVSSQGEGWGVSQQ